MCKKQNKVNIQLMPNSCIDVLIGYQIKLLNELWCEKERRLAEHVVANDAPWWPLYLPDGTPFVPRLKEKEEHRTPYTSELRQRFVEMEHEQSQRQD